LYECYSADGNNTCAEADTLVCGEPIGKRVSNYNSTSSFDLSCGSSSVPDAYFLFEGEPNVNYTLNISEDTNPFSQFFEWGSELVIYDAQNCLQVEEANEILCFTNPDQESQGSFTFTVPSFGRYFVRVLGQLLFDYRIELNCSELAVPDCESPYPSVNSSTLSSLVNSNSVDLFWDPVLGSIGCQIQGGILGSQGLATVTQAGQNLSSYTIPGGSLHPGATYRWRVRCGCSQSPLIVGPWSDFAQFTFGSAIIGTAPNPTDGISNVTVKPISSGRVTLEVIDLSGRLISRLYEGLAEPHTPLNFQFDGSDLPNGIYLYRLTTKDQILTEKMMIMR
jgi:hypothetical protein